MMARCGSCGGGARRSTFRLPAAGTSVQNPAAAQAGTSTRYEVIAANGKPTGRRFSSLIAASGYASRIGGSTRPV